MNITRNSRFWPIKTFSLRLLTRALMKMENIEELVDTREVYFVVLINLKN